MVQKLYLSIVLVATFLAIISFRSAEAGANRTCYVCENCDTVAQAGNKTGCNYCQKQYMTSSQVKRSCITENSCVAINAAGLGTFCCDDKDFCNAEPGMRRYLSYATLAVSMAISLFLTKISVS